MTHMTHHNSPVFTRSLAQSWAAVALLVAGINGCSSGDVTELERAQPSDLAAAPASEPDKNGLSILESSPESVSGTFARDGESIAFDMEGTRERHLATIYDADGNFVLRMTLADQREMLEFGSDLSFDGPQGSLFGNAAADWSRVTTRGDTSQLASWADNAVLTLVAELGPALSERSDVNPEIIPPSYAAAPSAPVAAEGSELGTLHQALAVECGVCTGACQFDFTLCTAFAGIFWGFCVPPFITCMNRCTAQSFCQ
jgi:hypothetical protein